MREGILEISLLPRPFYHKFASQSYTLFLLQIKANENGSIRTIETEFSDEAIKKLLEEISSYLSRECLKEKRLSFSVPWIMSGVDYPIEFLVHEKKRSSTGKWTFQYIRSKAVQYECEIDEDRLRYIHDALYDQWSNFDFTGYGETAQYSFTFPTKEFEWWYSAKALERMLNEQFAGHTLQEIFVSALNYADPLTSGKDYVNYYLGTEIILVLDELVADLLVHAEGLFETRVYDRKEVQIDGPRYALIDDGDEVFCEISEMFDTKYQNSTIICASVESTNDWAFSVTGFDSSKVSDPVELPLEVRLSFAGGKALLINGGFDDFTVAMVNN